MQRDEITEREYWRIRAEEIGKLAGFDNWNFIDLMNYVKDQRYEDILRPEALEAIDLCKANGLKVGILFENSTQIKQIIMIFFDACMVCHVYLNHHDYLRSIYWCSSALALLLSLLAISSRYCCSLFSH